MRRLYHANMRNQCPSFMVVISTHPSLSCNTPRPALRASMTADLALPTSANLITKLARPSRLILLYTLTSYAHKTMTAPTSDETKTLGKWLGCAYEYSASRLISLDPRKNCAMDYLMFLLHNDVELLLIRTLSICTSSI